MKTLPDTAYILVGRCLAPVLTDEQKAALARDLSKTSISWKDLLAEANRQQCTPLWYARLKEHHLLERLPDDLQEYLSQLTSGNRARNQRLKNELVEILRSLAEHGIPVLLLKGAATFANKLYRDPGARLMADLDLLIPEDQVHQAQDLLIARGYVEDPEDQRIYDTFPLMARHSHLAPLHHAEKGTLIELHYKVAYGKSGRVINAEEAWKTSRSDKIDGGPVQYLLPTLSLLLNALHATLPHQEFLRGHLALKDLAEFAALWNRYGQEIDRSVLFRLIDRHRLHSEFTTYALVSHLLMHTNISLSSDITTAVHIRRILKYGSHRQPNAMAAIIPQALSKTYYYSRLPRWAWQNVFYGDEGTSNWRRFGYLFGGLFNARFRENAKF